MAKSLTLIQVNYLNLCDLKIRITLFLPSTNDRNASDLRVYRKTIKYIESIQNEKTVLPYLTLNSEFHS